MSEAEGATANQEDLPGELEGEEDKLKQKKRNEPHRLKFWAKYKIGKGTSLLEKSGRPLGKLRCLVLRRQHAAYSYLRPEFLHYFERSLRPFGHKTHANISAAHSKRRTNNMRTLAFKLKKRALNWMPLSRQPPFHCSKCGLMSRRLRMMDKHVCAKRGPDYKNVAQTVELGFRSRAKDALAVLERIPRPQAQSVRLSKYEKMCIPSNSSNTLSQEVLGDEPKTLFEIAWNSVQKMYGLDREFKRIRTTVASTSSADNDHHLCQSSSRADTPANITAIPTATVNIRMPNTFQQTEKQQQEQNIPKGIVYFCRHCSRLFSKYADWDGHLEKNEEGCQILGGSEPMEIRMLANECLHAPSPPTVCRQPAFTSSPSTAAETDGSTDEHHGPWQCTKCSTGEFLTRTEFHTHLLKCALLEMDAKNGMGNGRMPMAYGESHLMNTNDEYGKAGSKTKRTRR